MIYNPRKKIFVNSETPRIYHKQKQLEAKIVSFEDYNVKDFFSIYENSLNKEPHKNIFIVRDAYNLFASRNKKAEDITHKRLKVTPDFVNIWKMFVKEAFKETNFTDNKIVINFNEWASNDQYRKMVSKYLELPEDKDNTNIMTHDGNGSSFDGLKYKNNPGAMKVLDRWKYFKDNKKFMSIFEDKELIELNKKYFNIEI